MTTSLGILAALGLVGALGAAWDRFGGRRHRRAVAPSPAAQTQARGTLDYYEKVWDSTSQ